MCVCVCMCVCVYMCMCMCVCVYVYVYVYVYMCMCICVCVYVCMYVYVYVYVCMCVYVYMCICVYVCICVYMCMYICVYMCMCVRVCVCVMEESLFGSCIIQHGVADGLGWEDMSRRGCFPPLALIPHEFQLADLLKGSSTIPYIVFSFDFDFDFDFDFVRLLFVHLFICSLFWLDFVIFHCMYACVCVCHQFVHQPNLCPHCLTASDECWMLFFYSPSTSLSLGTMWCASCPHTQNLFPQHIFITYRIVDCWLYVCVCHQFMHQPNLCPHCLASSDECWSMIWFASIFDAFLFILNITESWNIVVHVMSSHTKPSHNTSSSNIGISIMSSKEDHRRGTYGYSPLHTAVIAEEITAIAATTAYCDAFSTACLDGISQRWRRWFRKREFTWSNGEYSMRAHSSNTASFLNHRIDEFYVMRPTIPSRTTSITIPNRHNRGLNQCRSKMFSVSPTIFHRT